VNSEGFRETLSEERQRGPKRAKMAGRKDAKQKAGPRGQIEKNREEAESSAGTKNTSEGGGQRAAQSVQQRMPQRKETQRDPKGQGEPKKPGMTKRRQVRKVATMVKRLKKNPEDAEQQPMAEAGAGLASEGGWDAQQQATVAAYAHSRGMQPREVLQALVNSMEKTLRKEKGENLAGQTSSLDVNQQEEAAGKSEIKPNPGRGGRDLREKKVENNCVACSKDKKRGVPPKTRWKEEHREKARSQEARGKENRAMAMSSPGEAAATPVVEGSEPQRALKEVQKDAESSKGENTKTPVACVAGVPRGPVSTGEIVRVTPSGSSSGSSRGILYEINQQYLRSKYKFKEGAPLKEYLRQRVPNLGDTCTLWEVLTWLKEIIRDNLLFDESNPAMIVRDAPLEAALRKKRVDVNEIRSVVQQQLTMVEAGQGPLSAGMLSGGTVYVGTAPGNPRPEARAVTTQANTTNARVLSLTEIAAGPVLLYSPAPGNSQIIGTVSYTPPQQGSGASALPRPAAGQNGGGVPAATMPAASNFTGVWVRPLNRVPGAARGPGLSREAAASISQVIVTLTLLLANAGPTTGFLAYSCDNMRSPVAGYELAPREGCWMKQPAYTTPEPKDGRIVWMRDGVRFPVTHCKMTETIMQADCDSRGQSEALEDDRNGKIDPDRSQELHGDSDVRKGDSVQLHNDLGRKWYGHGDLRERVKCGPKGQCPSGGSPGTSGKAYTRLTIRRIAVWERAATESLFKKTIGRGMNDIIPNYVAGGMDAAEGAYVWNYTTRNCPEEELEELYKGKLGILNGGVVTLDKTSNGQKAWLRLERGVTICGRRMRQTHLPHVYVEWDGRRRMQDVTKRYVAPLEERELESMRLEWSYLRGRDDYMLRRGIQDAMTNGCWMKGMLMDLRQLQAAGREGPGAWRAILEWATWR
jgi:hypothetical protein